MSRKPLFIILGLAAATALSAVASAADPKVLSDLADAHVQMERDRDAVRDASASLAAGRRRADLTELPGTLGALPARLDRYESLQAQVSADRTNLAQLAKDAVTAASAAPDAEFPEKLKRVEQALSALITAAVARVPTLPRLAAAARLEAAKHPNGNGAGTRTADSLARCANGFDGAGCGGGAVAGGPGRGLPSQTAPGKTVTDGGTGASKNGVLPKGGAVSLAGGATPSLDRSAIPLPGAASDAKGKVAPVASGSVSTQAQTATAGTPRLTGPAAHCAAAVNGPDQGKPEHSSIASLCGKAPAALLWAPPMLAGMVDSIKEQFGTVTGILSQIGFFLLGLMATVATGALGVILKLIALVAAGWAIASLLWKLQKLARAAWSAPEGSVERYTALRQLGAVLTTLVVMVVMILAGMKYGKSAGMKGLEAGVAKAMNGIGLKAAVPGAAAGAGSAAAGEAPGGLKQLAAEVLGPEKPVEPRPVPPTPDPVAAPVSDTPVAQTTPNPKAVKPPEPPPEVKQLAAEPVAPSTPKAMVMAERIATMDKGMIERMTANPSASIGQTFVEGTMSGLREARTTNLYDKGSASLVRAAQSGIKTELRAAQLKVLQENGLKPEQVISHGTNVKGFLGMMMKGKIISTLRQTGISGETPEVWGAMGVDAGAGYGATTGVRTGQPGVAILMRASSDLKVVAGETLSRAPTVEGDFLAVVISDGKHTVTIPRDALRAAAACVKAWAAEAKAAAYKGDMRAFDRWEKIDDALSPK